MPIYEYRCAACGERHDALQKVSDAPLTDCPHCGAAALSKVLTAAGFQLKGSGWYATDFKGGNPAAKSDPAADKPAEAPAQAAEACSGGAAPCAAAACAANAPPAAGAA
ncbi:MAG: zinc ribbon domain-containing protein [Rhodocyclaceae bacterium]|nr:zinc ribbon domain-containing protein [Rhodocyclaceae bacterium]